MVFNDYSSDQEKCDLPYNIDCSQRPKLRKYLFVHKRFILHSVSVCLVNWSHCGVAQKTMLQLEIRVEYPEYSYVQLIAFYIFTSFFVTIEFKCFFVEQLKLAPATGWL